MYSRIPSTEPEPEVPKTFLFWLITILLFCAFEISVQAQETSPFQPMPNGIQDFQTTPDLSVPPEYSGIAYSGATDTFFTVDDEVKQIFEFSLDGTHLRTIDNNISGIYDTEGISWMYANTFVIGIEGTGYIHVVTINPGQTTLTSANEVYSVKSPIPGENRGAGIEGVSFDYNSQGAAKERFFVLREGDGNPPVMIYHIDQDGTVLQELDITRHMSDGTGIHHSQIEDVLYVLNRSRDRVFKLTTAGDHIWDMHIGSMRQPEGLTLAADDSAMWVGSEPNQFKGFTNTNPPNQNPTDVPPVSGDETEIVSTMRNGDDDAEERKSDKVMDLDSSDLELINDSDGDQLVGLRFQGVQLPAGANIISAQITFTANESQNVATSLTIHGEANPNPPLYRWDAGNISNRSRTSANVAWNNLPAWSAGQTHDTPNLATIVQEIVNSGWASGNPMAFVISGTGHRTAESYNGSTAQAPKLTITYSTGGTAPPPAPNNAPVLTALSNQSTVAGVAVSIPVNATDADDDTLTFSANGLPAGISINSATGEISGTPATANRYNVAISVNDGNGGTDTIIFTWTVTEAVDPNNQPPAVIDDLITKVKLVVGDDASNSYYNFEIRDPDGDPITVSGENLPPGVDIGPGPRFSGTPTVAGVYNITIILTDDKGATGTATAEWIIYAENEPPVLTNPGPQTAKQGSPVELRFEATDRESRSLRGGYTASNLPPGLAVSPGNAMISGTPNQQGTWEVTVQVEDTHGATDEVTFPMTVVGPNSLPSIENPDAQISKVNQPTSFQIVANDANGDSLTFRAEDLPTGLTLDEVTGIISGTPTEVGEWLVLIYVKDQHSTEIDEAISRKTIPWTITDGNLPPEISPLEDLSNPAHKVGNFITLRLQASDPDGDSLTFSADGLPRGIALDPNDNAKMVGTFKKPGDWTVTIRVKDGNGGSDSATFKWTVGGTEYKPVVSYPGAQTSEVGVPVSLQIEASDRNDDVLAYYALGLPLGLSINVETGLISGTPTKAQTWNPTINVYDGSLIPGSIEFQWFVVESNNQPPAVVDDLNSYYTAKVGQQIRAQSIVVEDPDGDTVSVSTENMPPGIQLSQEFFFHGTPTVAGIYDVTITLTDSRGAVGTATTQWRVESNDQPDPPSEGTDEVIYFSSAVVGDIGGLSFRDEDIVSYDPSSDSWSMVLDGSDVGLEMSGEDINAFHIDDDGSILLSIAGTGTLPDVGTVEKRDIVRFVPTSLGANTAGTFEMILQGTAVGLTSSWDNIDAISRRGVGEIVISLGNDFVPAVGDTILSNDLMRLNSSTGAWQLYFDGSDVEMDYHNEDIEGVSIGAGGVVHINTYGLFDVPGLRGDRNELFSCKPSAMGGTTACQFSKLWSAPDDILSLDFIDGIHVGAINTVLNRLGAFDEMPANGQEADLGDQHDDTLDNETAEGQLVLPSMFLPLVTN